MELRQYWTIVRSRAWIMVLFGLVALIVSVANAPRSVAYYKASVRLAVRPQVEQRSGPYYTYDGYYAYVASEYLNDDIGKVIESGTFMAELRKRALRDRERAPSGSFEVKKAHRILMVEATAQVPEDALLMARLAADMLADPQSRYFELISGQMPLVSVVDEPTVIAATPASRMWVDIAVRTLLGLLVGIALAFLLDFLDDTVRGREDLEVITGLGVLGEIPMRRGRRTSRLERA